MIDLARKNAAKKGLKPPRVAFVQALLTEPLPLESGSVDCILSNCVVNLLPLEGKANLFKEVYRVLKSSGRIVLDDVRFFTLSLHSDNKYPIPNRSLHANSCLKLLRMTSLLILGASLEPSLRMNTKVSFLTQDFRVIFHLCNLVYFSTHLFVDALFVDTKSDLNIYYQAEVSSECCASSLPEIAARKPDYDVNEWVCKSLKP